MSNFGTVKNVISGDTIVVMGRPVGGPPPERELMLSHINAPRMGMRRMNVDSPDEPFAWESREHLRKLAIGQPVEFRIEGSGGRREIASVRLSVPGGKAIDLGEVQISNGWASVRQQARSNPAVDELRALEDEARKRKLGVWGDEKAKAAAIRDMRYEIKDPRKFVADLKGRPVPCIVEHVPNGSTVKILLIFSKHFYQISMFMSGIQTPGFKRTEVPGEEGANPTVQYIGEPFAAEAKYFTEIRVLGRDLTCQIDGVDKHNHLFGTLIHPAGNIAEELCKAGYAKVVDWSAAATPDAAKLRAAEREAKKQQLRIWRDFVAPVSNSAVIDPAARAFCGRVVDVMSGDTITVADERDGAMRRISLSSIRAPRLGNPRRPGDDDMPYAREAKEFLRRRLIGQRVEVAAEYTRVDGQQAQAQQGQASVPAQPQREPRVYATVVLPSRSGKVNIAEAMVMKGLAGVMRHRQEDPDRSLFFDMLVSAERRAQEEKRGIHSAKEPAKFRVNDVSGDSSRARALFPLLQRDNKGKVDAIVEYEFSAGRIKCFLPKHSCSIVFSFAGLRTPRKEEPFAAEGLAFTRSMIHQRDVILEIEAQDKSGAFLGSLFIDKANMGVLLIQNGLAKRWAMSAERSPYAKQLLQAEQMAIEKKIAIYAHYVPAVPLTDDANDGQYGVDRAVGSSSGGSGNANEEAVVPLPEKYVELSVSHVISGNLFYATKTGVNGTDAQIDEYLMQLATSAPPLVMHAKGLKPGEEAQLRGSLCTSRFSVDGMWYRCRVDEIEKVDNEKVNARITYIDYGNDEIVDVSTLHAISQPIAAIPPRAIECVLAHVTTLPADDEDLGWDAARSLHDMTQDRVCAAIEEVYEPSGAKRLHTVIFSGDNASSSSTQTDGNQQCVNSVNAELLRKGLAKCTLSTVRVPIRSRGQRATLQNHLEQLRAVEEEAKKERIGIWQYGEASGFADDDDAPEFGMAKDL